jgi:nucleotide-binding universal stress UspA family protein
VFAALEHADVLDLEMEEQEDPPIPLGGRADCLSQAVVELQNRGLIVSGVMRTESPERVLLRQAADWRADAIFIGASTAQPRGAHNTAWDVIEQACCPVEIVRAGEHALHPVIGWAH